MATTFPPSASVPFDKPCEGPHLGELFHLDAEGRRPGVTPFPGHRLDNGHWCFRVTQTFDHVNLQFSTKPHGALDFGNFNCGDKWLAPADGIATTYGPDQYGALAVIIQHPDGYKSLCWHVDGFLIPKGVSTPVRRGQPIAIVGDTGLGAVCHGHWEVHRLGVKVDPWPLLRQNYKWEADVKLQGKFVRHIVNKRTSINVAAARFRAGPYVDEGKAPTLQVYGSGTGLYPVVEVQGGAVGTNAVWYGAFLWVDGEGYTFGYIHESVVGPLVDSVSTGGYTQAQLDEATSKARAAGRAQGIQAARDDLADLK